MKIVSLAWDAEEKSSIQIAFIEDFFYRCDEYLFLNPLFFEIQHLKKNYSIL